jgi:beta-glucosidase
MKRVALGVSAILLGLPLCVNAQSAYLNPSLPIDQRVDDLIHRLTPAEKTSLLSTTAPAIPRLKVPAMNGWNQCLHGIVWSQPTTMFPSPIAMAATWDPALTQMDAHAIADEGRAVDNLWPTIQGKTERLRGQEVTVASDGKIYWHNGLVYRSPVINMDRDPRWGRIWETFGEDPLLTSRMAVAFVKGMQGDNPKYLELAATLKHYTAYDDERDRVKTDNDEVDERTLRDYYLPNFKEGIMAGGAASIMSTYNGINGTPNAENRVLLTEVLRNEWKFQGFVVPDSGAVQNLVTEYRKYPTLPEAAAKTVLAGSDLDDGAYARALPDALAQAFLRQSDVDNALRRVLTIRFRLGEFDPPDMVPYTKLGADVIDSPAHRELALQTAEESIVLLKNEDHLLPLDKDAIKTLAVIGPFADYVEAGANYTGQYSEFVKPLDGIRKVAGPETKVLYARGSGILETDDPDSSLAEAVATAKKADVAVLFLGVNQLTEREGINRQSISLPPVQLQLLHRVLEANPKTVVVLLNGGPVSLVQPRFGGAQQGRSEIPAVLDMFWGGEEGGTAIANALFGNYDPSGRLPYTMYASDRTLPRYTQYDISKGFTYMYVKDIPEFAFGHGLSYTSFGYSGLKVSPAQVPSTGVVHISVKVKNTGNRAGAEVVQLYLHNVNGLEPQPTEQLQGFTRVDLKPGEEKEIGFTVPAEQLSSWSTAKKAFAINPGKIDVSVGSASDDIRQSGSFEVTTEGAWPPNVLTTRMADTQ